MGFEESGYRRVNSRIENVTIDSVSDNFKLEKKDFKPLMDSIQSVMKSRIERLAGPKIQNTNNFTFVDINVARFLYQKHELLFKKILSNKDNMKHFSKQLQVLMDDVFSETNLSEFSKENIKQLNDVIIGILKEKLQKESANKKNTPESTEQYNNQIPVVSVSRDEFKSVIQSSELYLKTRDILLKNIKRDIFRYTEKYFDDFEVDKEVKKEITEMIADLFISESEKAEEAKNEELGLTKKEWQKKNKEFKKQIEKNIGIREKRKKKEEERETTLLEAFKKDICNNARSYNKRSNFLKDMMFLKIKNRAKHIAKRIDKTFKIASKTINKLRRGTNTFLNISKGLGSNILGTFKGKNKKENAKQLFFKTIRIGSLGVITSLKLGIKSLSLLSKGFFLVIGPIFRGIVKIVSFAFNTVKNVVFGFVKLIGKTVTGIKNSIFGLYNFIKNNVFSKRVLKFLRSDLGAMFLGTLAAFIDTFVLEPIAEYFKPLAYDPLNKDYSSFERFLNNNPNAAYVYNKARILGQDIKLKLSEMNPLEALQNLMDNIFKVFTPFVFIAKALWNICKFVAKYRFTSLALKHLKLKGGLVTQLVAIGAGFALDMIFNSLGKGKKDGDDEDKLKIGIDLKVMAGKASNKLTDRTFGTSFIRRQYKGSEEAQDRVLDKYDMIMNSFDDEQEIINNIDKHLSDFSKESSDQKLTDELGVSFSKLFDDTRTSIIFGKHEIVPGTNKPPNDFNEWDRNDQLQYLYNILDYRKSRLQGIQNKFKNYGNDGSNGDIEKFMDDIVKNNKMSKTIYGDNTESGKAVRTYSMHLQTRGSGKFNFKILEGTLGESEQTSGKFLPSTAKFMQSNQQKIQRFETIASTMATKMSEHGEFKFERGQIMLDAITNLKDAALNGDMQAIEQIEKLNKAQSVDEQQNVIREFLQKSLEDAKNGAQRGDVNFIKYSSLSALDDNELYQSNVVIPNEQWKELVEKYETMVKKENGVDEWEKEQEFQKKSRDEIKTSGLRGGSVWGG